MTADPMDNLKICNLKNHEKLVSKASYEINKEKTNCWQYILKRNQVVKIEMANELIRKGFSKDFAYRFFNIEPFEKS